MLAADAGGLSSLRLVFCFPFSIVSVRETYSYMVDPDEVGLVDGDGVASPDVLGVDIGDGDVPGQSV